MKKIVKRIVWVLLGGILLASIVLGVFVYKVKYGFPFYDDTPPELPKDMNGFSILLFNKTNGFPHTEAIETAITSFEEMAARNGWSLFSTDNGAVFNEDQLAKFDLVIWNNATGRNLNESQRRAFEAYIENGGGYVGIHGAGDDSHHWPWYYNTLIGARFSHHPLDKQIQEGMLHLECSANANFSCAGLPEAPRLTDEWYVFFDNPRANGFTVLYTLDETGLSMNGNLGLLVKNKNFGMGDDHPIAWYKCLPNDARTFYSAIGHNAASMAERTNMAMLERAITWSGGLTDTCP